MSPNTGEKPTWEEKRRLQPQNSAESAPGGSMSRSRHPRDSDSPPPTTPAYPDRSNFRKDPWRNNAGQNARQDNWRFAGGPGSGGFIYESQAAAKQAARSSSDTRFGHNPMNKGPNSKAAPRKPKECPNKHDLILCMPLSIPHGKIHVTQDAGANFYDFEDDQNSDLLFSNSKGVCDVWASFLQVRLGMVRNVTTQDIIRVVEDFNEVMSETSTEWEDPHEILGHIEMECVGLYETKLPDLTQDYTGTKHSATFCETHGQLSNAGKEILKKIRRKIKRFALSLTLNFHLPMANLLFPLRMDHIKYSQKVLISQALQVEDSMLNMRDDAIRVLLNAISKGILPAVIPDKYRTRILERQAWPDDEEDPDAPEWAKVGLLRRGSTTGTVEGVMKIDLQDFIRDAEKPLRVLIREWSELSDPDLFNILRSPQSAEIRVPKVYMGEVRMEHTTKKMMDPRWKGGFVLTRQMAGEEDPRVWAEADAAGRLRATNKVPEANVPTSPRVEPARTEEFRARYVFGETPVPECVEPPPHILEGFIRRWKKVFTRNNLPSAP